MNLIDKETFSEYEILQNLISNFGIDRCIDCMKETFGVSQVTYGDSKEGEADALAILNYIYKLMMMI